MPTIFHTIIIGAGQAGLAAGYFLKEAGEDFLILDAHERVGDSWRKRWEGLRLFSPQRYNALPGLTPPFGEWHLPSRLELADYLEDYARHFGLPVRNLCTCVRARIKNDSPETGERTWEVTTNDGTFLTRNLIVATGAYSTPTKPEAIADSFPADIRQLHSSEIRNVADIADAETDVLVVGAGASGQQLSRLLLDTGASVTLAGPTMGNLPRSFLGKDIYWWLYNTGVITLRTDKFPGKLLLNDGAGDVTVGEPPLPAAIRRIKTHIARYSEGSLRCKCEKTAPDPIEWPKSGKKGVVLWCTGYKNLYPWLPTEMMDEDGRPLLDSGRSEKYPEVTFIGQPNLLRPSSSLVGGVGRDAKALLSK
ncbi:flavin-containing monooxygenase [Neolewinella aurantiaca]|uniref:flavin-containing monooxygenase n=1 Tax=Neolewinella aurantiaca TaxID=2602767 RepID=UPI00164F7EE6|nr:NAD(P)/FAD-dependent oxidoreductase [Neolewinella aurantiaca]